jgi:hypothetical protein
MRLIKTEKIETRVPYRIESTDVLSIGNNKYIYIITVNKSALVGDFVHILKMHGENSIKLIVVLTSLNIRYRFFVTIWLWAT